MTDKKLAKMPIYNWGGLSFNCRCGNLHHIDVKEFIIEQNACNYVAHFAKKMGCTMHLVFEQRVYEQAEYAVTKKFGNIFDVTTSIIDDVKQLDIDYCQQILSQAKEETKVIVCVGGDNACQYGKYASKQLGVQWVFVNLLPDSDDVATNYATLWQNGKKTVFEGKAPDVILCDTELAYQFVKEDMSTAFALILQNALFVFDRDFANMVQKQDICEVSNLVAVSAVKDGVNIAKKPFSKNTIDEIFACQYKISVAKCLSKQKHNFAGIHALSYALQSKYPQYGSGELACVVADVLAKIYQQIVESNLLLTVGKDCVAHHNLIKSVFGIEVEPKIDVNANDEIYQKNIELFKQNLTLISKINNLCKSLTKQKIEWDEQVAFDCLALCTDIYQVKGLLAFANDKGMFEKQKD